MCEFQLLSCTSAMCTALCVFVYDAGAVQEDQLLNLHQSPEDNVLTEPYQCTEVNSFIKYV